MRQMPRQERLNSCPIYGKKPAKELIRVEIGLRPGWKKILKAWQFWCLEEIRKRRLKSDYLKIARFLSGAQDCWKDGENRLLLKIVRDAGEGRR